MIFGYLIQIKQIIVSKIVYLFYRDLSLGKKVKFKNFPSVLKHKSAIIEIKNQVTINSSNYGYHLNMHSQCKLYADRPNAKISIGSNTRIHGTCIHAYKSIVIGDNCLIAANTQILDGNGHLLSFNNPESRIFTIDSGKEIIIKNNVWIAANCIILGGTTIGEGAVITAGSVVKGNVPSNSIYGGNPATILKKF
ncbi:MAG: acyltransferase [Mesonia sp.]|uniref:acyltransferase n=1 Tax=Mesonia sp. TaxID=1960830 RepID=UPI003242658F